MTQGPKIGQLALYFGANDMGSLMIEENVVASAGTVHYLTLEQIKRAIREAGYIPRQRNVFYEYIDAEPAATAGLPDRGRWPAGFERRRAIPVELDRSTHLVGEARLIACQSRDPGRRTLCKSFLDYQRGWVAAVDDVSFECQPGRDLRPARPQRGRQDDDPADPEHRAQADRRPRDRRRPRRADGARRRSGPASATCRRAPGSTTG